MCAELADSSTPEKRRLQRLQLRHMIHTCSDSCFDEADAEKKHCKKKYPREFRSDTIDGNDSYPLYRRRSPSDGGVRVKVGRRWIDNRDMVPTNLWLLGKFVNVIATLLLMLITHTLTTHHLITHTHTCTQVRVSHLFRNLLLHTMRQIYVQVCV